MGAGRCAVKLTEHLRSLSSAHAEFDEIVSLQNRYEDTDSPEQRRHYGECIAGHWERIADEAEASRATRLMFNRWSPQQMRAEAAEWRSGLREPQTD